MRLSMSLRAQLRAVVGNLKAGVKETSWIALGFMERFWGRGEGCGNRQGYGKMGQTDSILK